MNLYVCNRETGMIIEEVNSIKEGLKLIEEFEETDKKEGTYSENFYDIENEYYESNFEIKMYEIVKRVIELDNLSDVMQGATQDKENIDILERFTDKQEAIDFLKLNYTSEYDIVGKLVIFTEYLIEENVYNECDEWLNGTDLVEFADIDYSVLTLDIIKSLDNKHIGKELYEALTESEFVVKYETVGTSGIYNNSLWIDVELTDENHIDIYYKEA